MSEPEADRYDLFVDACRSATQYPYTLLKRTLSRAVVEGYHEQLIRNDAFLFDTERPWMAFWEAWTGFEGYQKTEVESTEDLAEHLMRDEVDPRCRHVFIEANSSRHPLNCSADMLKTLLTYHQISPLFLDSVFTFGDQDEPLDAGLAHFQGDDALGNRQCLSPLARLGRSGQELRHSYLLRSLERLRGEEAADPWSIRQVAVYHAFDVVTGRAVWITVKGNDLLMKRIVEDSIDLPIQHGVTGADVGASFEASLATHLIFFHWCEENWRWFVRDMEERVRVCLFRRDIIPVEREPYFTRLPEKTDMGVSAGPKSGAAGFSAFAAELKKGKLVEGMKKRIRRTRAKSFDLDTGEKEAKATVSNDGRPLEWMLMLNMFNYKDLKKLNSLLERLDEAILVIQLDVGALRDAYDYYQVLPQSEQIVEKLRANMAKSVPAFLTKLRQIIRGLETRQTQLVALRKKLDNGKGLHENLFQLRSLQVSRIFAEHGHRSTINMENIAQRTERDTLSIHIITVVTMLFLPATFLGTFFQSGVFQWADTSEMVGDWMFRTDVFRLFIAICVPMTVLTLLAWLVVNTFGRVKERARRSEDVNWAETITRTHGLSV